MTATQLQKLTPEAKRVALAEACGYQRWRYPDGEIAIYEGGKTWPRERHQAELAASGMPCDLTTLPDYLGDLNAALTLVDHLAKLGWRCSLANGLDCTWECEFMRPPLAETHPDFIGIHPRRDAGDPLRARRHIGRSHLRLLPARGRARSRARKTISVSRLTPYGFP